jgi:hypothetical protein
MLLHRCCVLSFLLLILLLPATLLYAQILQPLPDLDLQTDGTVSAIARQSDGSMVIGGDFNKVNGASRPYIARLLSDGSLDPNWNPQLDGRVSALAVDSSGAVYAGGDFFRVNGLALPRLVKLAGASGAPVAEWSPAPDRTVTALASRDSSLYVGGNFNSIGGMARSRIARISTNANGAADSWNPSANSSVDALSLGIGPSNDALFVGGSFTTIGGQSRNRIAKLSLVDGAADLDWNPSASYRVNALVNDGRFLYAGGDFTRIGTLARARIARFSTLGFGAAIETFNAPVDKSVHTLVLNGPYLYAGGEFTQAGGQSRAGLARMLFATGVVDATWNPAVPGTIVNALRIGNDDAVYVGGKFLAMAGQSRLSLARIESDASSIVASTVTWPGKVFALARQANGGVIVGGDFAHANTQARRNLLRLQPDGTLDLDWAPKTNAMVFGLAIDSSDRVYATGGFTSVQSVDASTQPSGAGVDRIDLPRRGIVRLAAGGNGDVDPTWDPQSDSFVGAIAIAVDDTVYVGGGFTSIGGAPRNHIARLSPINAAVDPVWNPDADADVYSLALVGDGSIYTGGNFTYIGGQARSGIAKLSQASGVADVAWNPGADNGPAVLLAGADGALFAAGYFSTIGGVARPLGLAKLSGNGVGAVDAQWNPPLDGWVAGLAFDSAGALYAAGWLYEPGVPILRTSLYKLNPFGTGAIAEPWHFTTDGGIYALMIAQGKAWIGGWFSSAQDTPRAAIAMLAIDVIFRDGFEAE